MKYKKPRCCHCIFKSHAFFRHINWDDLLARKVEPPFKPFLVSLFVCLFYIVSSPSCETTNWPGSFFFCSNQLMTSASLTPSSPARLQWTAQTTPLSAKVPIKSSWWVNLAPYLPAGSGFWCFSAPVCVVHSFWHLASYVRKNNP